MNAQQHFEIGKNSTFVTVLACVFIVLGGVSVFSSLSQTIMLRSFMAYPEFHKAMDAIKASSELPEPFVLLLSNFGKIAMCFLMISIVKLVAAIGLLLRKNWARLVFIAMMALAILWNFAAPALMIWVRSKVPSLMASAAQEDIASAMSVMTAFVVFSIMVCLVFSALFGWIIQRLVSPAVKREFGVL